MTNTAAKSEPKAAPIATSAAAVEANPIAKVPVATQPAMETVVVEKPVMVAPTAKPVVVTPKAVPKAAPVKSVATAPTRPVEAKAAPKKIAAAVPATPAIAKPIMKEIEMNDTIKAFSDKTQTSAQDAMDKSSKMFEEMNAFGKGNIEAMVESSKIAAKGAEEIAKYSADYARTAVEKAKANAQTFASVKSPTELFKLQGDLAKEAMEAMMTEGAKFTENYLKLLGQIAQPISNRFAVAAEKVKIAA